MKFMYKNNFWKRHIRNQILNFVHIECGNCGDFVWPALPCLEGNRIRTTWKCTKQGRKAREIGIVVDISKLFLYYLPSNNILFIFYFADSKYIFFSEIPWINQPSKLFILQVWYRHFASHWKFSPKVTQNST